MNVRKGPVLAAFGVGFLAAALLIGTPLRAASAAVVEQALTLIPVWVVNPPANPLPVRQVSDPAATRMPFVKWIQVDLSKGDQIVTAHFFDVPRGQRVVLEYANVDMCTPTEINRSTINLLVGYVDPVTGQPRQQSLKLVTQEQGIFPDADLPGALYRHFGVSQQMNVYIDPNMPVDAWIYRDVMMAGHSEARLWLSGYVVPAS